MSNRLPSMRTAQMPSLPAERIEALHGCLEAHPVHPTRYCVRSDRAATTLERQAISAAVARLEAELAPWSNPKHVDAVVTRIFIGFEKGRGQDDDDQGVTVAEYVEAMRALPLAAIVAAADRFRSGTTRLPWNRRFRPSPAEFAAEAREGVIQVRTRLLHARRVLDAEVIEIPTQAQRDAVAEAARVHMQRVSSGEGVSQHRRETPAEISAVRDAQIRDSVERLREAGRGPEIGRLMAHLDARKAPPQDGASSP